MEQRGHDATHDGGDDEQPQLLDSLASEEHSRAERARRVDRRTRHGNTEQVNQHEGEANDQARRGGVRRLGGDAENDILVR